MMDPFAIRVLPVFMTVLLFILSIGSHGNLVNKLKNLDNNVVVLYSFFFGILTLYTFGKGVQSGDTRKSGWFIVMAMLLTMTTYYVMDFWDLEKVLSKIQSNSTLTMLASSPLVIIPSLILIFMTNESRYSGPGFAMLLLAMGGAFIFLLNSTELIEKKIARLVSAIVVAVLMIVSYMFLFLYSKKKYEKLAAVAWFITAIMTIIMREYKVLKPGAVNQDVFFVLISIFTVLAAYAMYKYPTRGDFTKYADTIRDISLIAGLIIAFLRRTPINKKKPQQGNRAGAAETVWIWLLSFVNIAVIDGYMKFVQTTARAKKDYDTITSTMISLPIIVNAALAIYTSYQGLVRSNKVGNKEIGDTKMIWLTIGTYGASVLSLLFNAGNLEQTLLTEFLEEMKYADN